MKRDDLVGGVRTRLKRYPPPFDSHYGVVPPPPPTQAVALGKFAEAQNAAVAALARIELMAENFNDPYVVSRILARQEAVRSSAIEGTNSTLDELLVVEEHDETVLDTARQVRAYANALESVLPRARELGPDVFEVDLFSDLHSAVMANDPEYRDEPGAFRTEVVWIGGGRGIETSTYNPTPPEDIVPCLQELVKYLKAENDVMLNQPLEIRMAIAHAHFEAVHPFRDGNGRVGRLLLPLMMAAEGRIPVYLSAYVEAHKTDYYDGLKAAQQRLDYAPLAGHFANAITASERELTVTRTALEQLRENWLTRRRFRAGSAALAMLDILPHYPVTTISRMGQLLGVTFMAAKTGIEQLVDSGILFERTGYQRNRIFAAREVLDVLNRPFGSDWDYEFPTPDGPDDSVGPGF